MDRHTEKAQRLENIQNSPCKYSLPGQRTVQLIIARYEAII